MILASAYQGSFRERSPAPKGRTTTAQVATIIEVHGRRAAGTPARVLYTVREGSDGQGPALYARGGAEGSAADSARTAVFAWCRAHGFEVVAYLEIPPLAR